MTTVTTRRTTETKVTYREVEGTWVAWKSRLAICQASTEGGVLAKLSEMGYDNPVYSGGILVVV